MVNGTFSLEAHTDLEDMPQPEIILVTVKAYDTHSALEALAEMAIKARIVVSLQNGLTNLEHVPSGSTGEDGDGSNVHGRDADRTREGHLCWQGRNDIWATIEEMLSCRRRWLNCSIRLA